MFRSLIKKHKAGVIFLGDIIVFFGSLDLTLYIRYGQSGYIGALRAHEGPFSIVLIVFVAVFYMSDLYSYASWRSTVENGKRFLIAMCVNFFLSISIFYVFGETFKLTPKLSLIVFTLFFTALDLGWRYLLARFLATKRQSVPVLLLSSSEHTGTLLEHMRKHPQLGYTIEKIRDLSELARAVDAHKKNCLVVIDALSFKDAAMTETVRDLLIEHVEIETLATFSERMLGRVPLSEIGETWLIERIKQDRSMYEAAKRLLDVVLAILGIAILSPVFVVLFVIIPLTSKGSAIYAQERVGKDGKPFTIYKFRNMYSDQKKNPDQAGTAPIWWQKNDPRVTPLGRVLRKTHLDELPQLFNILMGDMSFVGPRPERRHFTEKLEAEMPEYTLRTVVTPGLTGWAQLRYRYAGTMKESSEKLEYDLYYVKNRGFLFDLGIMARTVQKFL